MRLLGYSVEVYGHANWRLRRFERRCYGNVTVYDLRWVSVRVSRCG